MQKVQILFQSIVQMLSIMSHTHIVTLLPPSLGCDAVHSLREEKVCDTREVINTLRPRQNGRRFADDTLKRIFLNENVRISIKIPLKFVPKGPINKFQHWFR